MNKIKVSQLSDAQLEYLIARSQGIEAGNLKIEISPAKDKQVCYQRIVVGGQEFTSKLDYTTNWGTGGPLIEKYKMYLDGGAGMGWEAQCNFNRKYAFGATALLAICRAVLLEVFGEYVEVPA